MDSLAVNILDAKLAAPNADYLSYTLSKIGLAGWTELASRAYARRGLRVNAIAPGLMLQSPGQSEANYREMHAHNLLRRGVEPDDLIAALRYLIGARTVTGQTLLLDSGQRFMCAFFGDSAKALSNQPIASLARSASMSANPLRK